MPPTPAPAGTPAPEGKLNPDSTIFQENSGPKGDLP